MAIKSFLSEGGFSVGSVGSTPVDVIDASGNITAGTISGSNLTLSGNLTVNGTTVTLNSTTTTLDDPIITLGGDTAPATDDNKDRGVEFRWHNGTAAKVGFFGYKDSTGKFTFIPDATNTSEVFSGTKGTLDANVDWSDILSKPSPVVTVTLTGDVTGTASATLTSLASGTVTVATTVAADSVALGTDTTGNYVASITNGSYITGGNGGSEGAALTLAVDATSANTASKVVARDASGNFSAGTITAAGGVIASGLTANSWLFEARGTAVYGGFAQYGNNIKSVQYWNASNTISVGSSYSANVANDGDLIVSGKIGVGTLSPGGKLEVNFTAATGATALILRTSDGGANGTIRWQNSAAANGAAIGSNYNVSDAGALEFLNGNTTNVIFRSSGSVGIGITSPESALHIAKTGADEQLILGSAATNRDISMSMYSGTTKAEVLRFQSAYRLLLGLGSSITQQSFFTSGGERLTIVSGGNVGIGTTSPSAKLHTYLGASSSTVASNAIAIFENSGNGVVQINGPDASSMGLFFGRSGAAWYSGIERSGTDLYLKNNSAAVVTVSSAGNVGIGTTSPGATLEVSKNGASDNRFIRLTDTGSSGRSWDLINRAGSVAGNFGIYDNTAGAYRVFIDTSGNFGIGTTSPGNKLDVNGSVRTNDWYYVDGSGFGMYNNANAMWWASHASGSYSLSSNTTFSGIKLFSGGSQNTFRGHFYGDSDGQGFLNSAGNWSLRLDSSSRLIAYSGIANMNAGIRVSMPGGAAYSTQLSTVTGAFKIKLPTGRYKTDTMLRMTIKIYQYNTGQSLTFNVGGYNYNHATNTWLNVFAEQESDSNATVYTVRFGDDGTSNCIWIGETNSTWSYPQVFVSEFEGGYNGTTIDWASGWNISAVTAFDTVYTSRTSAVKVTSNNIGTYGVSSITGTSNQVIASASTGAVTLSLPQSIATTSTPTFGGGTLNGTLTVVKSNGGNVNGSANAAIYLSQDESSIQGPGTNTVIRMGGNLVLGANSTWIAATNGTAAITVNNSQNATFAGDATFNKNGNIQVTLSTASTTAGATNRLRFITPASTADVRSGVIEWYKDGSTFMGDLRFKVAGGIEIRNSADQLSFTTDDSKNATVYGNVSVAGDVQVGTSAGGLKAYRIYGWSGSGAGTAGTLDIQPYGNKTTIGGIFEVSGASSFFSSVTISGNLIVNGTTTTVNSTVSTIKDPVITLGGGDAGTAAASDDNKDRGIEFKWHNGTSAKTGFFGFDDSTGYLIFIPDATNTSEVFSGTLGDIQASNFRGNLIGNVTGNVSGSAGSVATLTAGTYLTGGSFNGSTNVTFAVDATSANTASKVVARDGSGNFSAGGITASSFTDGYNTFTLAQINRTSGAVELQYNKSAAGENVHIFGNTANRWAWQADTGRLVLGSSGDTNLYRSAADTLKTDDNFVSAATITASTFVAGNVGTAIGSAPVVINGTIGDNDSHLTIKKPSQCVLSFLAWDGGNYIASNTHYENGTWIHSAPSGNTYSQLLNFVPGVGVKWWTSSNSTSSWNVSSDLVLWNDSGVWQRSLSNILTLATSGTGLSGSATYNNSGAATFTVTSNATSANTASTIVARDASGNFTAGTITAALSGNATTATTLQTARNFTINGTSKSFNGSADVSWSAAEIGLGSYLPLSGGTLSGNLAFDATSNRSITWGLNTDAAFIRFTSTGNASGLSYLEIGTTDDNDEPIKFSQSGNIRALIDTDGRLKANVGLNVTGNSVLANNTSINPDSYTNTVVAGALSVGSWGVSSAIGGSGNAGHAWAIGTNSSNLYLGYSDGASANTMQTYIQVTPARHMYLVPTSGNVGIGISTTPGYKLEVNGSFAATTKSFVIKHPTKEGKKLRYGSLEGPENGVYVRGKLKGSNIIELPDYWTKLVDPESITVQLTPIGSHQKLYVEKIVDNRVYIANENLLAKAINCFFYVLAERCDVEKLEVEIDAN